MNRNPGLISRRSRAWRLLSIAVVVAMLGLVSATPAVKAQDSLLRPGVVMMDAKESVQVAGSTVPVVMAHDNQQKTNPAICSAPSWSLVVPPTITINERAGLGTTDFDWGQPDPRTLEGRARAQAADLSVLDCLLSGDCNPLQFIMGLASFTNFSKGQIEWETALRLDGAPGTQSQVQVESTLDGAVVVGSFLLGGAHAKVQAELFALPSGGENQEVLKFEKEDVSALSTAIFPTAVHESGSNSLTLTTGDELSVRGRLRAEAKSVRGDILPSAAVGLSLFQDAMEIPTDPPISVPQPGQRFKVTILNTLPLLVMDQSTVTVDKGQVAINGGTWCDADGDSIILTASLGTVTDNHDGTWSWSFDTTAGPIGNQKITITADDGKGISQINFNLNSTVPQCTVTSITDSGPGSLRECIDGLQPGGTIDFALPQPSTIMLTSGQLVIGKDMTIEGPGAGVLIISGSNNERVFEIMAGVNATIRLLAVIDGRANGLDEPIGGGAIRNAGSLSLENCIITGSQALYGGAIRNQGTMTVTNSIFAANKTIDIGSRAAGDGGAIFNAGTLTVLDSHIGSGNQAQGGGGIANMGTLELNNVTLDNNLATLSGGAIENGDHGSVTVSNSRVVNNKALGDDPLHGGGAIRNFGGTVIIANKSEVSNNLAKIGGGIYNSKQSPAELAEIVIDNSTVSTNQATIGGGIYNSDILDLINCTIRSNQANLFASGGIGGGIYNTGTATVRGCILNSNTANGGGGGARGGGIYNDGTLTLIESTVNDNSAGSRVDYAGGGIYNGSGELTVTDSTIKGNRLTGNYLGDGGGGLYNNTGNATLTNCTISGNRVSAGDPAGGIYSQGTLRLTNCTVVGNSGAFSGGIDGKAILQNTIIAYNTASPGSGDCSSNAIITSEGYNLDSDGTCDLSGPGDLPNTDPLLGPDYVPLPGSPAIDAVDPAVCPPPDTDQRGIARPQGASCDIGAYESPSDNNPPTTTISIAGTLGNNGWYRSDIVVTLSATDDTGVLKTEYGFAASLDAGCPGPWYTYTTPIQGTREGSGYLVFRSIDQAGNVEPCQKQFIGVDKTPPAIDVRSPQSMDYLHAATFEIRWKPFDKPSAIATDSATLDGQPVTNGQVVDLFFLKLGPHMVTIQATDNAGNSTTITIPFNVVADIDSLRAVTKRAYDLGWINKQSTYNSLDATLQAAERSLDQGRYQIARRQLLLFIYQLRLYNGKSINQQAYDLLRADGLYVLLHLP